MSGTSDPFAFSRRAGGPAPSAPTGAGIAQPPAQHPGGWSHFPDSPQQPANLPAAGTMGSIGSGFVPTQYPSYSAPMQGVSAAAGASSGAAFGGWAQGAPGAPGAPVGFDELARNPLAQAGFAYGRDMLQSSVARYAPGASALWESLRYYFEVNNSYVKGKIRKLLFPFGVKRWSRMAASESAVSSSSAAGGQAYAPPAHDDNAPDLYIPTMAFITYVLVCGLLKGTRMKFTPEVLVTTSSTALGLAALEVVLLRAAMYALAVDGAGWFDLVAYSSYKYVGLCINVAVGLSLGTTPYYVALLYTGCACAYFLINTLSPVVDPARYAAGAGGSGGSSGPLAAGPGGNFQTLSTAQRIQRNYLVIGAGAVQILMMWWLGYSSEM